MLLVDESLQPDWGGAAGRDLPKEVPLKPRRRAPEDSNLGWLHAGGQPMPAEQERSRVLAGADRQTGSKN